MKKLLTLIMACLIIGMVIAQSEQSDPKQDKPSAPTRTTPQPGQAVPGREGMDRQQMYRQMLGRRADVHQQEIAELIEIRKIAEEEGAARTAEAIQKLIDRKNAEYQENIERFERQRRERAEQIQRRGETAAPPKESNQPKAEGQKTEK